MPHERVLVAIIDANILGSMGPLAVVREIVLNESAGIHHLMWCCLCISTYTLHNPTIIFRTHCTFCCLDSFNLLRMQTAFCNCCQLR